MRLVKEEKKEEENVMKHVADIFTVKIKMEIGFINKLVLNEWSW